MKKLPNLTRHKQRSCSTCNAKPGENCVSIGAKGADKGNMMSTSVHAARRSASRSWVGKGTSNKRSKAARKAWRTRRANQQLLQEALVDNAPLSVDAPGEPRLQFAVSELTATAYAIFNQVPQINGITLNGDINLRAERAAGVITITVNE